MITIHRGTLTTRDEQRLVEIIRDADRRVVRRHDNYYLYGTDRADMLLLHEARALLARLQFLSRWGR
jgi:hypothetical protein